MKNLLKKVRGENFEVLCDTIKKTAFKITRVGQLVAKEASKRLNVPFGIIDLSLAPTPAIGDSVADILEEIGLQRAGAPGTTAALAMLNDQVKKGGVMASSYVGGEALPRLDAVTANVVGYLQSATEHYFYTANVVLSNKILPAHWSIPDWKDWNILKDYLNGEASLLKSGTWLPLKAGEQVQPATNLSGFNGIPVGMYVGAFQTDYEKKHLAYWTLDNANAAIDIKVFYLKSDTDIIEESNAGVDTKAFAIRCIRK